MQTNPLKQVFTAAIITVFAASFIAFPKHTFEASLKGLSMWWDVVFPSLFPFFIAAELLISFGVVSFIGVLLEPIMRPLFNVPGAGGFVWTMGLASGFPAGAKFTTRLRQENKISKTEGERLVSFSNSSNPLFIFGAIAVGFFHDPTLGLLLAAAHYGGNLIVGITMRFYKKNQERFPSKEVNRRGAMKKAFDLLISDQQKDGRPFGKKLGDAVQSSMNTLFMIGGFILFFSVINEILTTVGIHQILATFINLFFHLLHIPQELSGPFISGLFEITLGGQLISEITSIPLREQAIIVSFILAFNGLSVHAQVASLLAETDIRFLPFFYARIFHGVISAILAFLFWTPLYENQSHTSSSIQTAFSIQSPRDWTKLWETVATYGSLFTLLLLFSYFMWLLTRLMKDRNIGVNKQ